MNQFIAFLRAINVGGTGKLPMKDLRALCKEIGFHNVRTCIAGGNVLFGNEKSAEHVKNELIKKLEDYTGKPPNVFIRIPDKIEAILTNNRFKKFEQKYVSVTFLDHCHQMY